MKVLDNLRYLPAWLDSACDSEGIPCQLHIGHYSNDRLALRLMSEMEEHPGHWELLATLTLNMPDEDCPDGEVWIKGYNEGEGNAEWLIANGVLEPGATCSAQAGHVQVERFRLSTVFIMLVAGALVKDKVGYR